MNRPIAFLADHAPMAFTVFDATCLNFTLQTHTSLHLHKTRTTVQIRIAPQTRKFMQVVNTRIYSRTVAAEVHPNLPSVRLHHSIPRPQEVVIIFRVILLVKQRIIRRFIFHGNKVMHTVHTPPQLHPWPHPHRHDMEVADHLQLLRTIMLAGNHAHPTQRECCHLVLIMPLILNCIGIIQHGDDAHRCQSWLHVCINFSSNSETERSSILQAIINLAKKLTRSSSLARNQRFRKRSSKCLFSLPDICNKSFTNTTSVFLYDYHELPRIICNRSCIRIIYCTAVHLTVTLSAKTL